MQALIEVPQRIITGSNRRATFESYLRDGSFTRYILLETRFLS